MISIYSINDTLIKNFNAVPKGSTRRAELMKEDYIVIHFSSAELLEFGKGSYTDIESMRYEVVDYSKPTWNRATGGYDYNLRLDAWYFHGKYITTKLKPNSGICEVNFHLTTTMAKQADIIVANFTAAGIGEITYEIEDSVTDAGTTKYIEYNGQNLIDAITRIATTWNCEWWFEDHVLHFGKCEKGTTANLAVGDNVVEYNPGTSASKATTRLLAFGSTRNLPNNYRSQIGEVQEGIVQKRLMLPFGTPYLDKRAGLTPKEIVEEVVIFDGIFPRFNSAVKSVETYTIENTEPGRAAVATFYRITTDDFTFDESYILKGETLRVEFTSGSLSGLSFEAKFNPKNKDADNPEAQMYELIVNDSYGMELPNPSLHPNAGDKFILTGWDATKIAELGLVEDAENELLQCSLSYLDNKDEDGVTSNVRMKSDLSGLYNYSIGQKVRIINGEETRDSRIVALSQNLDIPGDSPTYTIGDSVRYSTTGNLKKEIDKQSQESAGSINQIKNKTYKSVADLTGYKDWAETMAALGLTETNGGYVLTNLIALRNVLGEIKAGINGLDNEEAQGDGIAIWIGGEMDDAKSVFFFDGSGWLASQNIKWTPDGRVLIGNGKITMNPDGSGSIADGKIVWNTAGQITGIESQAISINGLAGISGTLEIQDQVRLTWNGGILTSAVNWR